MAKRRKRGSGSVHLRKDGRWEGRAVTGYDDKGLPKTKKCSGKDKIRMCSKAERVKRQHWETGTRRRQTRYDPGPVAGSLVSVL